MKILCTLRAGNVVRQALYCPRTANPAGRKRSISISREDRKAANLKTSYEKLLMVLCANFSPGDWWVTLTYDDDHLPASREESAPLWRKFMRGMRKYRTDNSEPLKYAYCTQLTTRGGGIRLHHHMIMRFEDEHDKERMESLWEFGSITKIVKLKDFDDLVDKAHYMCREPRELGVHIPGERMWTPSRGLIRPKPEYTVIESDAVDISVPVGCTELAPAVQTQDHGGYKCILYYDGR